MNLTSFKYFLTAAQELNFTKAAKSLYITQQSLSEHIRRLEEEYHVRLFERSPSLRLTEAGKQLRRFAAAALDLDKQIVDVMSDVAGEKCGSVSIGMRSFYGRLMLPEVISTASQANPGIQFHVMLGRSQEMARQLLEGQLDLAIIIRPYALNSHFISQPLFTDKFCLAVPENLFQPYFGVSAEEFKNGAAPDYSHLDKVPLIMYKTGSTREKTEQFLISKGCRRPNILMETANSEIQLLMCTSGCGVTITYERIASYCEKNRRDGWRLLLIPIPFAQASDTLLCYYDGRTLSSAARSLMKITLEKALMFS